MQFQKKMVRGEGPSSQKVVVVHLVSMAELLVADLSVADVSVADLSVADLFCFKCYVRGNCCIFNCDF